MTNKVISKITILIAGAIIFLGCEKETIKKDNTCLKTNSKDKTLKLESLTPTQQDSIALVRIFENTNGDDWYYNDGWLNDNLKDWRGVKTANINGQLRVVELHLGANNLKGTIPNEISLLNKLEKLDLGYNYKLNGTIPEELYTLKNLKLLDLGFTALTGELSSAIGNLNKLDTLDLRTSPWVLDASSFQPNKEVLTGKLPKEIGNLVNATCINIGRQGFSGNLPPEIGNLKNLQSLFIESCQFSGELPASLSKLTNLKKLFVSRNHFSGKIPDELSNLSNLEKLYLNNNQFEGTIPESFGKLKKVWILRLDNNKLSGSIPESLSKMKSLEAIFMGDNNLSGEFPKHFAGKNQQIGYVDVSNNNLTGNIPVRHKYVGKRKGNEVFSTVSYTLFHLAGNRFTGTVTKPYLDIPETLIYLVPQQKGYGFDNLTYKQAYDLSPDYNKKDISDLIQVPDFD